MKKIYLVLLILLVSTCLCFSQTLTPSELRDLKLAIKQSEPDSTRINLLLELSRLYVFRLGAEKVDLDSSVLLTQQAEALALKTNYRPGLCACMYQYSVAYREGGEKEKAKAYAKKGVAECLASKQYEQLGEIYLEQTQHYDLWNDNERNKRIELLINADSVFQLAENKKRQADALKELGDHYQISANHPEALRSLKKAQALYESIKYSEMQGVYDLIGYCCTRFFFDYQTGLKYGLLAIKYAEQVNDTTTQLATIHTRVGYTYSQAKNHEKAEHHFSIAYKIFEKYGDISNLYVLMSYRINNMDMQSKHKQALDLLNEVNTKYKLPNAHSMQFNAIFLRTYTKVDDLEHAREYCDIILANNASRQHPPSIINLIAFFIAADRFKEANQWLTILDDYILQHPENKHAMQSWSAILKSNLAEKRGNYKAALEEYKGFKILADTLHNTQKSNQTFALQIEYEAEQKDREIKLKAQDIELLKTQAQIQEQSMEQSRLIRNVTFAGAGVLIVFLGLIYNQYRLKAEGNKKLLSQQDEIQQKNKSLQNLVEERNGFSKKFIIGLKTIYKS